MPISLGLYSIVRAQLRAEAKVAQIVQDAKKRKKEDAIRAEQEAIEARKKLNEQLESLLPKDPNPDADDQENPDQPKSSFQNLGPQWLHDHIKTILIGMGVTLSGPALEALVGLVEVGVFIPAL